MSVAVRQDPALRELNPPLVQGATGYHDLTDQISSIVEAPVYETPMKYWIALGITSSILVLLLCMLGYLAVTGIGVWGNNRPIGWAWDITNFVFWIGIGHAGTLISAILFLFRQNWRTGINRFAEAIVFGNINDPESRVAKLKKQERNYAMLAELDIKPRTTYLARVRNPNPELEA